jgi:hypothetical protein
MKFGPFVLVPEYLSVQTPDSGRAGRIRAFAGGKGASGP